MATPLMPPVPPAQPNLPAPAQQLTPQQIQMLQQQMQQQQQQQQQMMPPPNPALQALLDSLPTITVPFELVNAPVPGSNPPQSSMIVVCKEHKQVVCDGSNVPSGSSSSSMSTPCGVDFSGINYMFQFLKGAPVEAIPPPPNVPVPAQRAEMIKMAKEQGNTAFKNQNFPLAIQHYSRSADMALSRPPWEVAAISRDETAIALCNRSAAFAFAGQWGAALADAETVVALKRPWTKGHFRKSRALVGLGRLEEAREALIDGLQFEPEDKDLNSFLQEIDGKLATGA